MGGVAFSASGAVQKEKDFTITAQYHENKEESVHYKNAYWCCGFGTAVYPDSNNIKIGSITPQEIDGFKILNLQDQGYYNINKDDLSESESYSEVLLEANRKCILHIKGKDYSVTHDTKGDGNIYIDVECSEEIGIVDGEKIKVTYTLL